MQTHRDTDAVRAAARQADHERERMVLTPTEARQGSGRQTNFRVLVVSLAILSAIGLALTAAYWGTAVEDHSIPAGPAQRDEARRAMDGSNTTPPAAPARPAPQP